MIPRDRFYYPNLTQIIDSFDFFNKLLEVHISLDDVTLTNH